MGNIIQKLMSKIGEMSNGPQKRILMLGLDGAGKTTILFRMKLGEVVHSVPTIGFNVEKLQYKSLDFTIWDVGGQKRIRELWKHYFEGTNAIIFIVDSSDEERMGEVRETLHWLLAFEELNSVPLLVFANKQDLATKKVDQICQDLDLSRIRDRQWQMQGSSALNGDGLYEGFDWLAKNLKKR